MQLSITLACLTVLTAILAVALRQARKRGAQPRERARDDAADDDLNGLEASLQADESITDRTVEELRTAAAKDAPFAVAMLASVEKDWHGACFWWSQVLRARPESAEAKFQLAFALYSRAAATPRHNDTQAFLRQSAGLYAEAAQRLAGAIVWNNWGDCLNELAGLELDDLRKRGLLAEARDRYHRATELDADNSAAWHNWGNCLNELADLEPDTVRKWDLLAEAHDRYQRATDLDAANSSAWNNWGSCLSEMAALEPDALRKRDLLAEAHGRYQRATNLNAANSAAWSNWGNCLGEMAVLAPDAVCRRDLLAEALGRYQRATGLDAANSTAWNNWGFCLNEMAVLEPDAVRRRELLAEAHGRYQRATELDADRSAAWSNWGFCLAEMAALEPDAARRRDLLAEAHGKYHRATELDAANSAAWNNWGFCLRQLAELEHEASMLAEAACLLEEAEERCRKAVRRNALNPISHAGLGRVLLRQALLFRQQRQESRAERLFAEARDYVRKARALQEEAERRNLAGLELMPLLTPVREQDCGPDNC